MVAAHPSLERALLDDLIHAVSSPIERMSISQCPFCDDRILWNGVLEGIPAPILQSKAQDKRIVLDNSISVSLYHRHKRHHTEQLAFFTIPTAARDDDNKDEESDTRGQFAQIATGQSDTDRVSSTIIETCSEDQTSSSGNDEDTNEGKSITHPEITSSTMSKRT